MKRTTEDALQASRDLRKSVEKVLDKYESDDFEDGFSCGDVGILLDYISVLESLLDANV